MFIFWWTILLIWQNHLNINSWIGYVIDCLCLVDALSCCWSWSLTTLTLTSQWWCKGWGLFASDLPVSPVILSQNGGQPWTNCNRSKLNWFCILNMSWVRKKKSRRIPLGESFEKDPNIAYSYAYSFFLSHRVKIVTFRFHHENYWVGYLHQDKQKMYYKFFLIVC